MDIPMNIGIIDNRRRAVYRNTRSSINGRTAFGINVITSIKTEIINNPTNDDLKKEKINYRIS